MPVTLDLCNTASLGFRKDTRVDSDSVIGLFVSAAKEEKQSQQAQVGGRPKPGPGGQRAPRANVSYSETLLAHELSKDGDAAAVYKRDGGLVHALEAAYSNHRHLILRPDDVWHAILTQFSIYVNRNSESLRDSFVSHDGQKTLTVFGPGTLTTADYAALSQEMGRLLGENLKDPDLKSWIIPDFTTTTPLDVTVASVIMMATFKAYFKYIFALRCGIPRVTLSGSRGDWVNLRARVEKFDQFGDEPTKWAKLLRPVCDQFIACFDAKKNDAVYKGCVDFWSRVCHRTPRGSGPSYLCGWATVFGVWTDKGEWQGDVEETFHPATRDGREDLQSWPAFDADMIPKSISEVPVIVDDNGTLYNTVMLAGLPGFQVKTTPRNAVSPLVGWAMYLVNE